MNTERLDLEVLGKVVGTASGRDPFDEAVYYFYDVELNFLGQRAFAHFDPGRDLAIDYRHGEVHSVSRDGEYVQHKVNWAVFNA